MKALRALFLVAATFAIMTVWVGWIAVPVLAAVVVMVTPRNWVPFWTVPVGAGLGWLGLLVRAARADGFEALASRLDAMLPGPVILLFAGTVAFAAIVAFAAATVASAFRPFRAGRTPG